VVFERIEPRLSGDPALVLIPGGGGLVEAVRAAARLSREVALLLAPAYTAGGEVRPARQEVIDAVAALAEDPAAVRHLLERGLGEAWWENLNDLNRALRLNGVVCTVLSEPAPALPAPSAVWQLPGAPQPAVIAALTKARLILLGPGDPAVNLAAALGAPGVRLGVRGTRGAAVWVGAEAGQPVVSAWLGEAVTAAAPARWETEVQAQLLNQAAQQAKTHAGPA
jgi:hypothetical protein